VENNPGSETAGRGDRLGPRPVVERRTGRPMSASRLRLLETLEAQPEPTTLAALVAATSLHANTVREHLEALERAGLVTRHRAAPAGRGRPAWLYQSATPPAGRAAEYAGLAAALAGAIHRASDTPVEDATLAGEEWGRELARGHATQTHPGPTDGRAEVVALLDEIGFAPEPDHDHGRVRLTRCPLLEAAHRYPDIVCAVHQGLVRGALEEYAGPRGTGPEPGHGAGAPDVRLLPFAEPGACLLHLADRASPRSPRSPR
jgi:predicted ArsR family transcriptional regulator